VEYAEPEKQHIPERMPRGNIGGEAAGISSEGRGIGEWNMRNWKNSIFPNGCPEEISAAKQPGFPLKVGASESGICGTGIGDHYESFD